jgi:alkylation response protein AidB-like acyl-CoA dehydrogenase
LRASARKFLESECLITFVRQRMAEPTAMSEVFWQRLAEQGWFGILYPEEAGVSGLGLVDMTVLMEEMGRRPRMTCSSISSVPRPARSPLATRSGTANASCV